MRVRLDRRQDKFPYIPLSMTVILPQAESKLCSAQICVLVSVMAHSLPDLPYAYDALEPHVDARTMEIHHSKHHQGYVDKLSAALEGSDMVDTPVDELIADLGNVPEDIRTAVQNNGGGHANHSLFWTVMQPASQSAGKPVGTLADGIDQAFGSFDEFKSQFAEAAATRFGSWCACLYVSHGELLVCSTANQDSPLMGEDIAGISGTPILGLDVWEHAYYISYQNKRPEYIEAWWNVVNWEEVSRRFTDAN